MRKLAWMFAFLAGLLPMSLIAQTPLTVASQNQVDQRGKISPNLWTSTSKKYDNGTGFYEWYLAGQSWGEALVGPAFFPKKGMEIDFAVGLETNKRPLRGQAQIWMGNARGSFLTAVEYGGSGFWYTAVGNRNVLTIQNEKIGLGFRAKRYAGIGPQIQVAVGRFTAWGCPIMWDTEKPETNVMFGLTYKP